MQIYIENDNCLLFRPETPKDGFQLGGLYHAMISKSLGSLLTFPNGGPDMKVDANQLAVIDELLGGLGSGKGRVDRIRELLDIERAMQEPAVPPPSPEDF